MVKRNPKLIAIGISKKTLPLVKKDLRKGGYCGVTSLKSGRWFDVFYTHRKKRGKC